MKKMIILGCIILFLAPMVWAQEKCEAPTLNVGDKWRYGDESGSKWTQEVIAIENDIYVIRYGKQIRGFDKNTMNFIYTIDENNKRTKFTDTRGKVLDFPLYIGKKWSNNVSHTPMRGGGRPVEQNYLEEYFVSSYEDVKVMAGIFKAFKIEYRARNMQTMREGSKGAYWYSPDVKAIIKRVEAVSISTGNMELDSYKLKQ